MINKHVVVDLDCLLDTRLACVFNLDTEKTKELLKNNYRNRLTDDFTNIKGYKEAYKNRDIEILKDATPTPMLGFLLMFIGNLSEKTIGTPNAVHPNLLVNIHPYTLTKEEENVLLATLVTLSDKKVSISLINKSKKELSPKWLKREAIGFCIYDYNEWLETHSSDDDPITDNPIPKITLFGPRIFFGTPPDLSDEEAIEKAFRDIELFISPFVNLILLDSDTFSTIIELDQ